MTRSIIALCFVLVTTGYCGEPPYVVTKNLLADRFVFQPARPTASTSLQDDYASGPVARKNVPLATLYSLLLPGMGELYVERYDIGKYFTMAEGGLWLTWGAFQMNGVWVRDDARRFAMQHAGTQSMEGGDQYFIDIGNFDNVDAFNEQVLRDRDPQKVYDRTSGQAWSWDTPQNREEYRTMRVSSDKIFNNSQFVIAAVAINHVISAINAARLAISHNKSVTESSSLIIRTEVLGGLTHPHGIMISFTKEF